MDPDEVVEQATLNAGLPRTPCEQALAQLHAGQEYDLIYEREVFCLTDW